jgi:hypothetical protein
MFHLSFVAAQRTKYQRKKHLVPYGIILHGYSSEFTL